MKTICTNISDGAEAGNNIFATSLFSAGCNLRCPYCMNSKLVLDPSRETLDIDEVLATLKEIGNDWAMISGGEPTIRPDLPETIDAIKEAGYKIGLSTNGTNPKMLSAIMKQLNYVAMDIKSHKHEVYEDISVGDGETAFGNMITSKAILMAEKYGRPPRKDAFDYEIRTTMYPPFVGKEYIKSIGCSMNPKDNWIFQQLRHARHMIDDKVYEVIPYNDTEVEELLELAREYTPNVYLRHV